jgi:hypothetical protein
MKTYRSIIILLVCFLFTAGLNANGIYNQVVELKKEIIKEFSINQNGTLNIENKYGQIIVHDWDKNKVKFEVTITVKAGSEKKANQKLDEINIIMENGVNIVSAISVVEEQNTNWFWSWWNSSSNIEYDITYNVWCPSTLKHVLKQEYGNINTGIIQGDAKIMISYGDLKSRQFNGNLNLDIKYGDANIAHMTDGKIDLSYGELTCNELNSLTLESKYSKVTLKNAGALVIDSKYDGYNIGNCETLKNDGKYDNFEISKIGRVLISSGYTNIHINQLDGNADIENKYATIIIDNIGEKVSAINVDSKYSTLELPKSKPMLFVAEGNYIDSDFTRTVTTTNETESLISGFNLDKNAYTQVRFLGKYGKLVIK